MEGNLSGLLQGHSWYPTTSNHGFYVSHSKAAPIIFGHMASTFAHLGRAVKLVAVAAFRLQLTFYQQLEPWVLIGLSPSFRAPRLQNHSLYYNQSQFSPLWMCHLDGIHFPSYDFPILGNETKKIWPIYLGHLFRSGTPPNRRSHGILADKERRLQGEVAD